MTTPGRQGARRRQPAWPRLAPLVVVAVLGILLPTLVSAVLPATLPVLGPTPAGADPATSTTLPFSATRWADVLPDGRVLVAGGDALVVLGPDLSVLGTVAGIPGAADFDVRGDEAYVLVGSTGDVAVVDLLTFTRTGTITLESPHEPEPGHGLAVFDDSIWFPVGSSVRRYDRATGTSTFAVEGKSVRRAPGDDTSVFVLGGPVKRVSTAAPHTITPTVWSTHGDDFAVDVGADRIYTLGMNHALVEWRVSSMNLTLRSYADPEQTVDMDVIDYVPGPAPVLVGGDASGLLVFRPNTETPTHRLPGGMAELAPDGRSVYRFAGSTVWRHWLVPQVDSLAPASLVAHVPTTVRVHGEGFGGTVTATFDGAPVTLRRTSIDEVEIDVPAGVPAGMHDIALTNAWGTTHHAVEVVPNVGSVVQVTVRKDGDAVPGASVELTGSSLPGGVGASTDATGSVALGAIPYGTDYVVTVRDPAGLRADQRITEVVVRPNDAVTLVVDFAKAPATYGATLEQPMAGGVSDLARDPVSGLVAAAMQQEVALLDATGQVTTRIQGVAADRLAYLDGDLIALDARVGSGSTGAVARIDVPSGVVVDRWSIEQADVQLAVAGGRIFYIAEVLWSEPRPVRWIDPTTGARHDLVALVRAGLAGVAGREDQLVVAGESGGSALWDVGGVPSVLVAGGALSRDLIADGTLGRVWSDAGVEYRLDTLTPTGVQHPTGGDAGTAASMAVTPERGGVLAFRAEVQRVAAPSVTHRFSGGSIIEFGPGAASLLLGGSSVRSFDLAPRLDNPPTVLIDEPQQLTLTGAGLGAATVRVDGAVVPLLDRHHDVLVVSLPALGPGSHEVTVTTPWGSVSHGLLSRTRLTVTGVEPETIPTAGGTVTVTGTGFTDASAVAVGSNVPTSFEVIDDGTIVASFGPRTRHTAAVTVTGPLGAVSGPTLSWVAPQPVIAGVSPSVGSTVGAAPVTITGSGFLFAISVRFGGAVATFTVVDDTTIVAIPPTGPAGAVDVTVSTWGGLSDLHPGASFERSADWAGVTSLTPASGPASGGTLVTVRGAGFTAATAVRFGDLDARSFVVLDATTIVAEAPAADPGAVTVTVLTPGGDSAPVVAATFTYAPTAPGVIEGTVRSSAGPLAGMLVVVSPADRFEALATVVTGADGSFAAGDLDPGVYKVIALDPAVLFGADSYHIGELYDDGGITLDAFGGATEVVLGSGSTVTLVPIVLDHSRAGVVAGTVRSAGGHPLPGIEVVVSRADAAGPGPDETVVTTTLADGTFRADVAPGSYRVVVRDPITEAGGTGWSTRYVGGTDLATAAVHVVSPDAAVDLGVVSLLHTSPATVTGRVVDPSGEPVPGMLVVVSHPDWPSVLWSALTASDGSYTVAGVVPGSYKVGVLDPLVVFGLPSRYVLALYPGTTVWADAEVLTVVAGSTRALDDVTVEMLP